MFPVDEALPPPDVYRVTGSIDSNAGAVAVPLVAPRAMDNDVVLGDVIALFTPESETTSVRSFLVLIVRLCVNDDVGNEGS